jgi:hypothetical protein
MFFPDAIQLSKPLPDPPDNYARAAAVLVSRPEARSWKWLRREIKVERATSTSSKARSI